MRVGILVVETPSTSYGGLVAPARLGQRRSFRAACRAATSSQGHDLVNLAASEAAQPGSCAPGLAAQAQQQSDASSSTAPARRRGRPPGIPAWNKGIPHTESHRKRISMKIQQKWKDPEFKRAVSESMRGKQAWNEGIPTSSDTRRKMAEAKLGRRQPLGTRKAIAAAHLGRAMSDEGRAAVGERFRGAPKSEDHRAKLAAVARRRHAASRVLRAVEAVYSAASSSTSPQQGAASAGAAAGPRVPGSSDGSLGAGGAPPAGSAAGLAGGGSLPPSSSPNLGAVRAAAYSLGLRGLSDNGKRLSRTQILNTFKSELREYRTLQEELSTWTAAFREKHNRKPSLVDVQRTGIPWLIDKFKQYVVLRDRLFSDTSVLRGKLQEAIPDPESVRNANSVHGMPALGAASSLGALGPTNANGPNPAARSAVASRFAAVMDYKMQRQTKEPPSAGSVAAAVSGVGTAMPQQQQQQQPAEEPGLEGADASASKMMSSQAPPRVRMAMQAAMEYRTKQAQATKAAADAAAAAARAATSTRGKPADAVVAAHSGNGSNAAPATEAQVAALGDCQPGTMPDSVSSAALEQPLQQLTVAAGAAGAAAS